VKIETINNIFEFIKNNDNRNKPIKWKLLNNEPLTDDELTIEGYLNLYNTKIKSLPDNLEVKGDLYLDDTEIRTLPKGLKVGGDLYLSFCENINSLPEGLEVGGFLVIRYTPLVNFSDEELIKMIKPTDDVDGYIGREIIRE
jgi:hypothetical protein